jgi:hypothetical protein
VSDVKKAVVAERMARAEKMLIDGASEAMQVRVRRSESQQRSTGRWRADPDERQRLMS